MQKGKFLRKFSHRRNYPAFSFGLRLFQSSHLKIKIKLPHFGFASKNETQSRHSQIGEKNETKYTSNSTKSKNVEKRKIKDWKYSFTAEQQALHLKLLSLSEAIAGSEDKSEMGKGEKKKIKESGEVAHFNIEFTETMRYIEDLHAIENDTEEDDEIKLLAKEELKEKKKFLGDLQEQVIDALVDEYIQIQNENISSTECVVEIKQAMGGSESSLFCHLLMNMYQQFTQQMGWKWKEEFIMEDQAIGKGLKHGKFIITSQSHDDSPFNYFQHESGVHKVQRVPETEKKGRMHSSTGVVIVLPTIQHEVKILDKDIRIDTYKSQGAGGQHVNTTDSAVRLTHIPTGIVVANQDERIQGRNKEKAMKLLKEKILEQERIKFMENESQNRKAQIGTGGLSEKIRTYNFPSDRITDHRINVSVFGIDDFISCASDDLVSLILQIDMQHRNQILKNILQPFQN